MIMNDNESKMYEEFQSDNMNDLVCERKKSKAVESVLHNGSVPKKYYYWEHYVNGDSVKHKIDAGFLDAAEDTKTKSQSKEKQRADSLFYSTLPMVLRYEGGFVNNPKDKGGKTNMGVTQGFLNTYKSRASVHVSDPKDLTIGDVVKLYKAEWDIYGYGKLDNRNIMRLVYDFSVNSGPMHAIKYLQQALNSRGCNLKVDGYIGEKTNRAVNGVDEGWLKTELQRLRAQHYDNIVDRNPEQKVFLKGWFKRMNDVGKKHGCDTLFKSRHLKE